MPRYGGLQDRFVQGRLGDDLKGKTIASDITKSFTYTNTVIALSRAGAVDLESLWTGLKAQDPVVRVPHRAEDADVDLVRAGVRYVEHHRPRIPDVLKQPKLASVLKTGTYKEGQVMLGNQMGVLKGAPHPNAGKLLVEFLLSEEGADIYVEGEALYSFRSNHTVPDAAKPYLFDLNKEKLIGMEDWVGAQGDFKSVRSKWQSYFQ